MKYVWIQDEIDGMAISLFPEVAQQLGLRDGQRVDEATFRCALRLNADVGKAVCELNIAINEQNEEAETK
jgi:anaerobic selenocysteine-containing dehydrogenase